MHFEIFDYFLWLNTEIVLKIDWRLSSLYFLSRDDKIRYLFFSIKLPSLHYYDHHPLLFFVGL